MKKSEIEKLHSLLAERSKRLDLVEQLNNASILKITDGKDNTIISLGLKSPLKPYILKSIADYLNSIDNSIRDIDPDFDFEDEVLK